MVPRTALESNCGSGSSQGRPGKQNREAFWRHLGDFGRHLVLGHVASHTV